MDYLTETPAAELARQLNGINPEAYLSHLLLVIADHPVNRMDKLLP